MVETSDLPVLGDLRQQGNVGGLMTSLRQLLEEYTSYDLSSRPLMQLKIKALVLDLVHNMDVVDQLQR